MRNRGQAKIKYINNTERSQRRGEQESRRKRQEMMNEEKMKQYQCYALSNCQNEEKIMNYIK